MFFSYCALVSTVQWRGRISEKFWKGRDDNTLAPPKGHPKGSSPTHPDAVSSVGRVASKEEEVSVNV
ncbi:hypothetical protein ABEB36_003903 [Hypothenemus hampei]|uniref:Uncharacterized protein n=1 Tax=Hypothenemus hampei TaxID=57062 RepID=A0ABD1F1M5_HYPHA